MKFGLLAAVFLFTPTQSNRTGRFPFEEGKSLVSYQGVQTTQWDLAGVERRRPTEQLSREVEGQKKLEKRRKKTKKTKKAKKAKSLDLSKEPKAFRQLARCLDRFANNIPKAKDPHALNQWFEANGCGKGLHKFLKDSGLPDTGELLKDLRAKSRQRGRRSLPKTRASHRRALAKRGLEPPEHRSFMCSVNIGMIVTGMLWPTQKIAEIMSWIARFGGVFKFSKALGMFLINRPSGLRTRPPWLHMHRKKGRPKILSPLKVGGRHRGASVRTDYWMKVSELIGVTKDFLMGLFGVNAGMAFAAGNCDFPPFTGWKTPNDPVRILSP